MATKKSPSDKFTLAKSGRFLDQQAEAGIEFDVTRSPAVALALAGNKPFPPGTLRLGEVRAQAKGGTGDIRFSGGRGTVAFNASGGLRAGLGVYPDFGELVTDLGADPDFLPGLDVRSEAIARVVSLYWGYNLEAQAKGSVALAPGVGVRFGAEAKSEGIFAVVRAYGENPPSATAVADVVESWCLPRQVKAPDDIPPGTWVAAEIDGEFAVSVGATAGYDLNWIRSVNLQGLSGDIGLKIQAAAEVSLGFQASGRYLVIVGRESLDPNGKVLRIRLHKLAKKGMQFALNAVADVTPSTGKLLPEKLDELILGILGLHPAQLVEELKVIRTLLNPAVPLNQWAGDFLADLATKRFAAIPGIEERFNKAKEVVVGFLDKWDALGARASGVLWNAVQGSKAKEFVAALKALAEADTNEELQALVGGLLQRADFFRSPIGQMILSRATTGIVSLLESRAELAAIRDMAKTAMFIIEGQVITDLIQRINSMFGLDQVRDATFASLNERLKEKLSAFLGRVLANKDLEEIRLMIAKVAERGDQIYKAALKALNRRYRLQVHAAYQKSTTRTALLDVSIDFARNAKAADLLAACMDGNFTTLLSKPLDGVTIHRGVLTHGVSRNAQVDFNLPYLSGSKQSLNEALAKFEIVEQDGSIYMYSLEASDEARRSDNRNRWASRLAVSMKLSAAAGRNVRSFGTAEELGQSMTTTYRFSRAMAGMSTAHLQAQVTPLQERYLPREFGGSGQPTLQEWVIDMDKLSDSVEANGTGTIGNTLIDLEVSVPGVVLAGWLNAPEQAKARPYLDMSLRIQRALKTLLPYCYFSEAKHYGDLEPAAAMLVYQSLPPTNAMRVQGGVAVQPSEPGPYWDFRDQDLVRALVVGQQETRDRLAARMALVNQMLKGIPALQKSAQFYEPDQVGRILGRALEGHGKIIFQTLLFVEAEVIEGAVRAGREMAEFRARQNTKPEQALESLADFGSELTRSFSSKLTDLFDPKGNAEMLRNFGTLVFVEASRALQPGLAAVELTSMLNVTIMRSSTEDGKVVAFPPKDFPLNDPPAVEQVALEQRVLGTAVAM